MLTEEQEKALLEEIDKLRQDKAALISRVASLEQSLYWLRKKVFGRMSEKNLPLDPNQLFLFSKEEMSSMEISRMEDEVRKSDEEITRTIKVKEKPSRKPLDTSSLPVEVVDLYPEGTTDGEGRLKDDFIEIGKEESSRLERVPAKVYILKTVRHKVIRKSDMEKYPEERQILIHPLPLVPVSKCMAGASVLTDIIIGKFMYHLPFYRLIQQYRESGIIISESTMCGWYEMAVEKLRLLYNLLKQKILSSEYIQVDESAIPVLDNEKHKAKKGYEWCVRDGITGDVMFHYDRGSRSGMVARELLGCCRGIVQCDGYAAYEQFEQMKGITLAGCWAHVRRKYVDALEENRTLATQAIHYIGKLYKIESDANDAGLTTEERKEKRIHESYPLILEFEKWLQDAYLRVLPKSRMGKAIEYTYHSKQCVVNSIEESLKEGESYQIIEWILVEKKVSIPIKVWQQDNTYKLDSMSGCHKLLDARGIFDEHSFIGEGNSAFVAIAVAYKIRSNGNEDVLQEMTFTLDRKGLIINCNDYISPMEIREQKVRIFNEAIREVLSGMGMGNVKITIDGEDISE